MTKAVFEGLVCDENDRPCAVSYVGGDATYIVVEDGFNFHVDARTVDAQVLEMFGEQINANKDAVSEGAMKIMGSKDLFTKAAIDSQLKNFAKSAEQLHANGLPADARSYLGMMGFRISINRHGDVVHLNMPSAVEGDDGEY